jgi:hypothetical protein
MPRWVLSSSVAMSASPDPRLCMFNLLPPMKHCPQPSWPCRCFALSLSPAAGVGASACQCPASASATPRSGPVPQHRLTGALARIEHGPRLGSTRRCRCRCHGRRHCHGRHRLWVGLRHRHCRLRGCGPDWDTSFGNGARHTPSSRPGASSILGCGCTAPSPCPCRCPCPCLCLARLARSRRP